jgi:hypothetical protein
VSENNNRFPLLQKNIFPSCKQPVSFLSGPRIRRFGLHLARLKVVKAVKAVKAVKD